MSVYVLVRRYGVTMSAEDRQTIEKRGDTSFVEALACATDALAVGNLQGALYFLWMNADNGSDTWATNHDLDTYGEDEYQIVAGPFNYDVVILDDNVSPHEYASLEDAV